MNKFTDLLDDKSLVIMAVTILGVASLFKLDDPTTIIAAIVSGLCGVAVGNKAKP